MEEEERSRAGTASSGKAPLKRQAAFSPETEKGEH